MKDVDGKGKENPGDENGVYIDSDYTSHMVGLHFIDSHRILNL